MNFGDSNIYTSLYIFLDMLSLAVTFPFFKVLMAFSIWHFEISFPVSPLSLFCVIFPARLLLKSSPIYSTYLANIFFSSQKLRFRVYFSELCPGFVLGLVIYLTFEKFGYLSILKPKFLHIASIYLLIYSIFAFQSN